MPMVAKPVHKVYSTIVPQGSFHFQLGEEPKPSPRKKVGPIDGGHAGLPSSHRASEFDEMPVGKQTPKDLISSVFNNDEAPIRPSSRVLAPPGRQNII